MQYLDLKITEGKIIISPNKLILGGAAMFNTQKRNHQRERRGINISIPLEIKRLRVCVFS